MRPNMRPTEKTDPKGALNDLSAYMRRSLGVVILALVLATLSAVLTIIGPDQVGKIATIMSDGLLGGIDLAAIARVGILLAVIYGLSALFGFIQHYIMASVTLKMSYRMRAELSERSTGYRRNTSTFMHRAIFSAASPTMSPRSSRD